MPEAVKTWVDTRDIDRIELVQQQILDSYELDFAKHSHARDFPKLSAIWRSIPLQLARDNSKFIFSRVKKGWRAKDLEDALEWLISAGLVYKVPKIEKPFMPLSAYADDSHFKLYMSDIGLLRRMAGLPAGVILGNTDEYREFKGAMTENYFLGEWMQRHASPPFYWTSGNTAEVDFIVQHGTNIIPVEVKSERNSKAKSLAEYRKKYAPAISVKTSMNNLANGEPRQIPLYLLWQIEKYL
jgi:predicted AAA+ superfamily ATPase